jgi:elongation factor Ts
MMDCKKALQECNGEMEVAVDWLRQKGLSKAAKKAGRATSEGVVAMKIGSDNRVAAMVEVMCETDFVSRGDQFQSFAKSVAETVFSQKPADHAALIGFLGGRLNDQIAILGENMSVGRHVNMGADGSGFLGAYVHSNGKIGVLVEFGCKNAASGTRPEALELAKNIAMQIAAASPASLNAESLDPVLVERERAVHRQKTLDEGKPAAIVDKIVDGRIKKFYQEVCLVEQAYIRDDKLTVKDVVAACGKGLGDEIVIRRFTRLQLGENAVE